MRLWRLLSLLLLVFVWGLFERSVGVTPLLGLSLAASVCCAFELRLALSLALGSAMMAVAEWAAGLPVGAWALGATLGLIVCHLVLHTARPGALERAVAMVVIVVPGLVCSVIFSLVTGAPTGVPTFLQSLFFLLSAFFLSGLLVQWLRGGAGELWGQPG